MKSITAVVPCYNLGHVLPKAVESLKTQGDIEIIVVDDCSTDDSLAVAKTLGVKVVAHSENRGLSAALNTGFSVATGDRLVILSPDDLLAPFALSKMSAVDADVVASHMLVGGREVRCKALDLDTLLVANCHGYAALFKRWVWEETGGFKEAMNPSWEDYEFWLHAAKLGASGTLVPEPLFIYNPNPMGRSWEAHGKERLLRGKLEGFHQDLFGKGRGVVTVVIPLYEQEEWLPAAIESVRAQVYPHVEVLVVDDASPTRAHHHDLPVIRHEENRGLSAARNTGFSNTGTQYVVPLDADDELSPSFVEECMAIMGEKEYVYTDVYFIGDAIHEHTVSKFNCDKLYQGHIHVMTVLMQRQMWQDVVDSRGFGFDERMLAGYEDWEFTLAAVEAGWYGKYLPEPLFGYRFHSTGSMRIDAKELDPELRAYVRARHPRKEFMTDCIHCSKGKFTRRTSRKIVKPGLGEVGLGEPLLVSFDGESFPVKRGMRLYTSKRWFFACGQDAHLFDEGVFKVYRLDQVSPKMLRTAMEAMNVEGSPGSV